MMRRFLSLIAALALVAAACGNDDDDGVSPAPDDGRAEVVTVKVDGTIDEANVGFLQYFPSEVTVHAGTSIDFAFQDGDPHTVTFGTVIDEALAAGPDAEGPPPFPMAIDEAGNVGQPAALPCFVDAAGEIPAADTVCETTEAPAFAGDALFYNSGVVPFGETFTLDVDESTPEGPYSYICLIHGPEMSGTVTVVGPEADVPSAEEVRQAGDAELQETVDVISAAIDGLEQGTIPALEGVIETGPNFLVAGSGDPEAAVDILEFGPAAVEIAAGGTLTWNVLGFHTISFNATEDATPPIVPNPDGTLGANPLSFAPQGGWPGAPAPPEGEGGGGEEAEGPPPPPTNIDAGEWDGTGFVSSGVLPSFPPALLSYSVTFTEPGTYTYACLIHADMEGRVTVT